MIQKRPASPARSSMQALLDDEELNGAELPEVVGGLLQLVDVEPEEEPAEAVAGCRCIYIY